jgi:hypothetical protein
MPRKKKRQKPKNPKGSKAAQRRQEIKGYIANQLERIDPLDGLTYLGLTVSIYQGQSYIYSGLLNVLGLFGVLDKDSQGNIKLGMSWDEAAAFAIAGPAGYAAQKGQKEFQKSAIGAGEDLANWALSVGNGEADKAKEKNPDMTDEEQGNYAIEVATIQLKLEKLMIALGAAGCIMLFLKSYNWYQAVENIPGVNVLGTGVSQ